MFATNNSIGRARNCADKQVYRYVHKYMHTHTYMYSSMYTTYNIVGRARKSASKQVPAHLTHNHMLLPHLLNRSYRILKIARVRQPICAWIHIQVSSAWRYSWVLCEVVRKLTQSMRHLTDGPKIREREVALESLEYVAASTRV